MRHIEINHKCCKNVVKTDLPLANHCHIRACKTATIEWGACVIEKHVTLDRNGGGADDSFSLEPAELERPCKDTKTAWQALGQVNYSLTAGEKQNLNYRRSLYVISDIAKGELFTESNIRSIRPGYGLQPNYYDYCLGKKATQNISRGIALALDLVEG